MDELFAKFNEILDKLFELIARIFKVSEDISGAIQ